MAKLGWGTPTLVSLVARHHHRDPGQHRDRRDPPDRAADHGRGADQRFRSTSSARSSSTSNGLVSSRPSSTRASSSSTIEGEMGLLVAFGDDANFVVSVGGFHPRFAPPPLPFPSPPDRISLLNTPVSRAHRRGLLRRHLEHRAVRRARGGVLRSRHPQRQGPPGRSTRCSSSRPSTSSSRSPPRSRSTCSARACSPCSSRIARRPAPWHVKGHGSISLLFWDIDVDFEKTWGEAAQRAAAHRGLPQDELNKPDNWRALLPAG